MSRGNAVAFEVVRAPMVQPVFIQEEGDSKKTFIYLLFVCYFPEYIHYKYISLLYYYATIMI
jgi:hypothetical protein